MSGAAAELKTRNLKLRNPIFKNYKKHHMRLILVFVALSIKMLCFSQQNIDVLHYRYDVVLNDKNDTIRVSAHISFVAGEDMKTVSFDLASVNPTLRKGMHVTRVGATGKTDPEIASYKHEDNKITIDLPATISKGEVTGVSIYYEGIPADGLIITKNKFGHRGFFADNWPDRGHNWLACHDDPADKASVDFNVTAPDHYTVVANGVKQSERTWPDLPQHKQTKWKETTPISTKVMVIVVADIAVQESGVVDGIPVYSYVFK